MWKLHYVESEMVSFIIHRRRERGWLGVEHNPFHGYSNSLLKYAISYFHQDVLYKKVDVFYYFICSDVNTVLVFMFRPKGVIITD